jgi:uncharacterized cupin superfamily protein
MVEEARLDETETGLKPTTEGWFVVNVGDAAWITHPTFGSGCVFEGPDAQFKQLGINIQTLAPGEPNCLYHSESQQEDFLVLAGECLLLVEGEERPLKAWDFVHCPPGTEHVFVGAGDGPCVILMTGVRSEDEQLLYPVSEVAQRHGASAESETPSPQEAYARFERPRPGRPSYWDELPWS